MTKSELTPPSRTILSSPNPRWQAFSRIAKYSLVKAITLLVTVAIGLYLTILIVNLGGYVDKVFSSAIDEEIGVRLYGGWLKEVTDEAERGRIIEETRWAMQEARGLHQPFLLRSMFWLWRSMTLELGDSSPSYAYMVYSGKVQGIVLTRLPYTLVLVGLSNLVAFVVSILLALVLSRKPGSFLDRATILLSPVTSAPNWIFGVLLIFIFATTLRLLPFPKAIDLDEVEYSLDYFRFYSKYLVLPAAAVILSTVFQSIYTWRTFFLIYSHEDYVEVARAKGLHPRMLEARYILRPVLPYVITSFAVMMILFWQSAIALELLFLWPGIGSLFISAVRSFNTPLILGVVVIFAYMLAITVFLLDIAYAVLDPRVRVGSQSARQKIARDRSNTKKQPAITNSLPTSNPDPALMETPAIPSSSTSLRAALSKRLSRIKPALQEIARYPSAVFGLILIVLLFSVAIYTMVTLPYSEVVSMWRSTGEDWYRSTWYKNPVNAPPAWINFFRSDKQPETIVLNSRDITKSEPKSIAEGIWQVEIPFTFEYSYDAYPQDLLIYLDGIYKEKTPYVTFFWTKPDGTRLDLGSLAPKAHEIYYLTDDQRLERKLGTTNITQVLFIDPTSVQLLPLKGRYELVLSVLLFEPDARMEAEALLYGQVHGLTGTDHRRRDLNIAMLWGAPVALAFGLLGALGTSLIAMTIAAIGAWYSGWVDELIQRLTEINMILPALPIAILVFFMYSKSIWVVLGVVVLLNIFGSAIKNYRSVFLQAKEAPYIEAALAYGVSNWRIISKYLAPRIFPTLIPQLVIMAPTYVFYEATLAYLGVSDPYLPTWGKTIYEALTNRGLQEHPHWVLEPLAMLLITGLAFALLGFALDRVLNPRLREE